MTKSEEIFLRNFDKIPARIAKQMGINIIDNNDTADEDDRRAEIETEKRFQRWLKQNE